MLIGQDETRIGVVVKYRAAFFYRDDIEKLLKLANDPNVGQSFTKFLIVLVCENEMIAKDLRTHIPLILSIPINSSIVIGYLTPTNHFFVLSTLP